MTNVIPSESRNPHLDNSPDPSEASPPRDDISRRDVLKLAAMTPLAGVAASPQMERVERFMASLTEAEGQQQGYVPKFFTAKEFRTVRLLADYVIPRDDRSGSATDAKAPEYMDFVLHDEMTNEANRIAMRGGLAWLDHECNERFGKTFVLASDAQRRQVLDDIAWPRKAKPEHAYGVTFFNRFRDMTAAGFFSSAMGWSDLRYIGNVFNPNWNGCGAAANAKLGVSHDLMNTFVRPENDK